MKRIIQKIRKFLYKVAEATSADNFVYTRYKRSRPMTEKEKKHFDAAFKKFDEAFAEFDKLFP